MKTKLLLVGGTGYLGRHLREVLKASFDVYVTGTRRCQDSKYFALDFTDERTYDNLNGLKFDILLVLASTITGLGNSNLNNGDLEVNVWSYRKFLQFVADNKLTNKILYVSSMTVYGVHNTVPVEETGAIYPSSVYGLSKSIAESLTIFFAQHNEGKSVIVRIPGLFGGDRKDGFIYSLIQKCFKGEDVLLNSQGLLYWECIEIMELCSLLNDFLLRYKWEQTSDVFNFGYGEEIDFVDSAFFISKYIGSSSRVVESGPKQYVRFFLSNKKVRKIVAINYGFRTAIERYIEELRK